MVDAPERIRVAQDADGFWTCREAVSGSQEYVRADLYVALEAQLAEAKAVLHIATNDKLSLLEHLDTVRQRRMAQIDYSCDLQRIIEDLCRGGPIREPKTSARHHYDMATAFLSALEATTAPMVTEASEHCPDCDGTGFSNHPDSGWHCYRCNGQGAIHPETAEETATYSPETATRLGQDVQSPSQRAMAGENLDVTDRRDDQINPETVKYDAELSDEAADAIERLRAELAKPKFNFSAEEGELLFEIPRKIVVSIEPNGVGYAIFDVAADTWRPGTHEVATCLEEAGAEIEAALLAMQEKAGCARCPIIGIENCTEEEVFDIMCSRIEQLERENAELRSERASARSQVRREALEEAAKVAARMLVFADTTSSADKEIPAAIRRLAEQEAAECQA